MIRHLNYEKIIQNDGTSEVTPLPRAKRMTVVPGMEDAVTHNQQQTMQRFK
jgi:hypothetical protein